MTTQALTIQYLPTYAQRWSQQYGDAKAGGAYVGAQTQHALILIA